MPKVGFYYPNQDSANAVRGIGFYCNHLWHHLSQLSSSSFQIDRLTDLSQLSGFDLIHFPFFEIFTPSLPFSRPYKTVVTVHDVIPLTFPSHYPPGLSGKFNFYRQLLSLQSVNSVITDSQASIIDIKKYLHLPDSKLNLVYLAADSSFQPLPKSKLTPLKKRYSLPEKFILYVGDINYNKNLPFLISTCITNQIHLVIIGKNAAQIPHLDLSHPELRHLQLVVPQLTSPYLHLLGFIDAADLPGIYNLATAYCQPSFSEGFGLPALEAMACGCPVVLSSTASSLSEIAGSTGLYFSPTDSTQLLTHLSPLLTQPHLAHQLSESVLLRSHDFSWEKTAQLTLQVYENVFQVK